jgi:lysophospholipase L1-like esterase
MNKRPLKLAAVFALVFAFGWGYLAAANRLFPSGQIEAIRAYFATSPGEAGLHTAYWLEKTSFFDQFTKKASVVMIGDSLTDGAEWAEMFPGIAIANRGIDGDTTGGVLQRMEGIESVHAKKAFIMIGINDFAKEGRSVDAVFADYGRIVSRLEKSGAKVFVQSTLQCNLKATWISCAAIQEKIGQLNKRLATLASAKVAFIDLNANLSGEGGLKPELTYDGVHLNADGYLAWKRAISKFVLAG